MKRLFRKRKLKKADVVGGIILLFGLFLCGFVLYRHFAAEHAMETLLYERETASTSTPTLLTLEEIALQGDQDIEPPKTLKNCIVIPSCNIKAPFTDDIDSYSLAIGVGHFPYTPKAGKKGNACYAGHYSTIYNCIFNDIPKIKLWDEIETYDSNGKKFVYYVTDKYITDPTDLSVLRNDTRHYKLTIVTCAKKGTKRLIIVGESLTKKEIEEQQAQVRHDNQSRVEALLKSMGTVTITDYLGKKQKQVVKSQQNE